MTPTDYYYDVVDQDGMIEVFIIPREDSVISFIPENVHTFFHNSLNMFREDENRFYVTNRDLSIKDVKDLMFQAGFIYKSFETFE